MGQYSTQLSPHLASFVGVTKGQRALDVGSGPGALTAELVNRLGASSVAAVDPSAIFVQAVKDRLPGVDVRQASDDALPFGDQTFDCTIAQLVVHFMTDPVAGLAEMKRVTRSDGVVAACVWDFAGGHSPISPLWDAARQLDPDVDDESDYPGARAGHLAELFLKAGLREVVETVLEAAVVHSNFEAWWQPFTLGVGPAGTYVAKLDAQQKERLRDTARTTVSSAPFTISASAWTAKGIV